MNLDLKAEIVRKYGSQANFAQAVRTDETLVSRVINGRREIPREAKAKWARALGKNPRELFGDEDED